MIETSTFIDIRPSRGAVVSNTWVIVADASRARFFVREKNKTLVESESMVSPGGRLHERDRNADKPGRSFDSKGGGRHSMEPPQTTQEHESIEFAKRVAGRTEELRLSGELDKLVLVAPPRFLGQLRSNMKEKTQGLVALSIDKELTQASPSEVAGHLPEFF